MPYPIDETHDPNLKSWVTGANEPTSDFPIQNLPLGVMRFEDPESGELLESVVTRIGDLVLDLTACHELGFLCEEGSKYEDDFDVVIGSGGPLNDLADEGATPGFRGELRRSISRLLSADCPDLRDNSEARAQVFRKAHEADMTLPMFIADYTDFYASIYHATNVGSMFRPDNPLLPNYKHIPIGYHGRASSIIVSGEEVRRPVGQQAPTEDGGEPGFAPCKLFDYELEIGAYVAKGNELGEPISIEDAEEHLLGLCLVNDWSARDLQKWEYQPLGPFLAKSFATTVSPFIVTMEALAPFRMPALERNANDPKPLPYLTSTTNTEAGGFDIKLEVALLSKKMRDKKMDPMRISHGDFSGMYWTAAQMLTHHSSNGCNMQAGDLLASGTISGKARDSRGCMLELTWDGDSFAEPPVLVPGTQRTPITLPTGEERKFLEDGDEVIITGYCEREGFRRIGFGECRGRVTSARRI